MSEHLIRAIPSDLEVRGGDGRTVSGLAVPFGRPAEIHDTLRSYTETFRRGAFARTIQERGPAKVKVFAQHDTRRLPIGRASLLREDAAGLYCELRISQTSLGDEVLELVEDHAIDSLSIGFVPIHQDVDVRTGAVERTEVRLNEISPVAFPAYQDALISSVRSLRSVSPADALARLRLLESSYRDV